MGGGAKRGRRPTVCFIMNRCCRGGREKGAAKAEGGYKERQKRGEEGGEEKESGKETNKGGKERN